jgi:serine phosphatase RsbU (regulator of sigma subunit)
MISDGISEVPNENDEEFGLDRLEQSLRKKTPRSHPRS